MPSPFFMHIEFIRPGSNTLIGNFATGDRARVSNTLAAHFINLRLAKSLETVAPEVKTKTLKLKGKK